MATVDLDLERMSRLFQALGDETRLRIVRRLCRGEHCVCDLQEMVGAYQSRLSFHLRKLKDAGLVDDRREGRWVYYELKPEVLAELQEFLGEVADEVAAEAVDRGCAC